MKKIILYLGIILLTISGCSNSKTEDVLNINNIQSGIGSIDETDTHKQKFSYTITLSNKEKIEIKSKSIEIVLTHWIKKNQIEEKITEITFNPESIIIKGYVIFNSNGETKREIVSHEPFIDGVNVVTEAGEKIF